MSTSNETLICTSQETLKITSLNPNVAGTGGGDFTLTVNGENFTRKSVVQWNGADRKTTFISSQVLTAAIKATDIASPGSVTVRVADSSSGSFSNELQFTILAEIIIGQEPPVLTSINPGIVKAPSGEFTLTVTGANFQNGSVVRLNGTDITPLSGTPTNLTVKIPALEKPGLRSITVFNPSTKFTSKAFFIAHTGGMDVKNAASLSEVEIAKDSIAFADGTNLAGFDEEDQTYPLDQTLMGGASVVIENGSGTPTDAFLHRALDSISPASPDRVKFLVPLVSGSGVMTVTVTNENGDPSTDDIMVGRIAPGLFSGNSGLADGDVLRVINGVEQIEQLTQAIDLSRVGPNHKVFLRLNATGLRNAGNVTATVGAITPVQIRFGIHRASLPPIECVQCEGMDEVIIELPQQNVTVPHSATIQLTAIAGAVTSHANPVTITLA